MSSEDVRNVNESAFDANAISQASINEDRQDGNSQTASEYINSQLQLEADAREALPYSFDHCTQPLGALKQSVFSCITCNPPPKDPSQSYQPAGLCYGCSIACHGEHTLVELFARRNFTCDCGTTRLPEASPCTLRVDPVTGLKGPVHSQEPASGNTYNKNFRNRFCGCDEWYDPHQQKGTMYQCLGLATEQDGGCGEDWWHPECLLGLPRDWYLKRKHEISTDKVETGEETSDIPIKESNNTEQEHPAPPGFPDEDDFDTLICYKCVEANPWIKKYAKSKGFMTKSFTPDVGEAQPPVAESYALAHNESNTSPPEPELGGSPRSHSQKRKAEDLDSEIGMSASKRAKIEEESKMSPTPRHASLPAPPAGKFSILTEDDGYRQNFCRCAECYPHLAKHPQLLEEEETYEPPVSEEGDAQGGSVGTGSLLERGEAALSNMDRVRAIEGVMVYNHLKDKVKSFLQPFADSGKAVGAEDIKAYFEKLRGDHDAIRTAGGIAAAGGGDDGPDSDNRKEQSGY